MSYKEITHIEQIPEALNEIMRMLSTIQSKILGEPLPEKTTLQQDKLLTRKEAAAMLRISLVTLGEMSKRGDIKAYRLKNVRGIRYKKSEIAGAMCNIVTL